MKIIAGLMRAHKDCHDTKFELLELWVNEIYRTYFEKLSKVEKPDIFDRVSTVMMYYFGDEAKMLLSTSVLRDLHYFLFCHSRPLFLHFASIQ